MRKKLSKWKIKQELRAVRKQFKAGFITYGAYLKKTRKLLRMLRELEERGDNYAVAQSP
ncbi:MAG: hypothetical protein NDF54_07380 [archaeon GB-1867-035]|nr:hypothetical protein [Candidatus Culexmicrobium profundum]